MGYPVQVSSAPSPAQLALLFFMRDTADGATGKASLTPNVTLQKNIAGFGSPNGTVGECGGAGNGKGWYYVTYHATDQNTLGTLTLNATSAGALPANEIYPVVAFNPLDVAKLGLNGIPAAVWDEAMASHLTANTTGAKLNSAASAGDPLTNSVPGSYAAGTAGFNLGQLGAGSITFTGPVISSNNDFTVIQGDDYLNSDGNALPWTIGATPNLTSATVVMRIQTPTITQITGTITGAGTSAQIVRFDMSRTITGGFNPGNYSFDIQATLSTGSIQTLVSMAGMRVKTQVI